MLHGWCVRKWERAWWDCGTIGVNGIMLVVLFLGSQFSSGPCSVTVFTWPGRRLAWWVDWFRTWRSLETLCNKSSSFYNDFGRLYIVPFAFLLILYFGFTFKELELLHFDVKIFDGWKDVFSCLCTFKLLVLNDGNKLFQLMTKWKGAQLHSPRSGHGPLIFLSGPYQGSRGARSLLDPGRTHGVNVRTSSPGPGPWPA